MAQIVEPEVASAKKDEVDSIIRDISKLSADDFAEKKEEASTEEATDPLKEYKLDKPQSKIMADLNDGTARVLLIGEIAVTEIPEPFRCIGGPVCKLHCAQGIVAAVNEISLAVQDPDLYLPAELCGTIGQAIED